MAARFGAEPVQLGDNRNQFVGRGGFPRPLPLTATGTPALSSFLPLTFGRPGFHLQVDTIPSTLLSSTPSLPLITRLSCSLGRGTGPFFSQGGELDVSNRLDVVISVFGFPVVAPPRRSTVPASRSPDHDRTWLREKLIAVTDFS
ncbi:hypothetical protein J6590_038793 [Homalodisca vitripennis]|nr:hypothetical protein J6590_038793 [Homalodisca vitripennis]